MDLSGFGIGDGVAVGPVIHMVEPLPFPSSAAVIVDAAAETEAAMAALAAVATGYRAAAATVGTAADLLLATAEMAEDPDLLQGVLTRIAAGSSAEQAVVGALSEFRLAFVATGGSTAERAADLDDIAQRCLAALRGVEPPSPPVSAGQHILVARDLAPADTALLDPDLVLALVTEDGGPTGHTAILARSRGIPAVVAVKGAREIAAGTVVVVDAGSGTVTVALGAAQLAAATERSGRSDLAGRAAAPCTLSDGTPIPLLANLGSLSEVDAAIALGAEGVGLFRTEFLFGSTGQAPTVAEQRAVYRELLQAFPGRRVVIRLLDAGSDKPLPFLGTADEANPALGLRGLRALRAAEPVLHDQLAALAEAAVGTSATLSVMAPMVTEPDEAAWLVSLCHDSGLLEAGVMVEVPALALLADELMPEVDFVSIGTNDLVQYTLAADRAESSVSGYQDPWHPAVLRLVGMVGSAGERHGVPVGLCGEAAADPALAVTLVGLGATSLSMAPSALAGVRSALSAVSLDQARRRAAAAVSASSASRARLLGT